jgi:hypothetical protein
MNVSVNIEELKHILDRTPAEQNIMLTGRHGIGKSEILTAYFAEKGMKVVALFLGQMSDPGDLIGLPDKSGDSTVFRPPYWFPKDGKPIVLFLDELNRARPEVLQTIMDLALNRKLAGRTLPAGSRVISAVNEGEEYQLTDLDPALVSRFNIVRFEPSLDEWLLWARKSFLDERVIHFISENGTWLDGDPTLQQNEDTGLDRTPDRRAWTRVSDIIKGQDNLKEDVKLISSIIGVKATQLFISKMGAKKLVTAEDLVYRFDSILPMFHQFKQHDYAILNGDVIQYLETRALIFTAREKKQVSGNLLRYIDHLQKTNNREALMHFSNTLHTPIYKTCYAFIRDHAKKIEDDLLLMTAKIHE